MSAVSLDSTATASTSTTISNEMPHPDAAAAAACAQPSLLSFFPSFLQTSFPSIFSPSSSILSSSSASYTAAVTFLLPSPVSDVHPHTIVCKQSSCGWLASTSFCLSCGLHFVGEVFLRTRLSSASFVAWQTANSQHALHSLALLALSGYPPPYYYQQLLPTDAPSSPPPSPLLPSSSSSPLPLASPSLPPPTAAAAALSLLSPLRHNALHLALSTRSAAAISTAIDSVQTGRWLLLVGLPLMSGSLYWLSLTELRSGEPLCGYWKGWRPMDMTLVIAGGTGIVIVALGWAFVIRGMVLG